MSRFFMVQCVSLSKYTNFFQPPLFYPSSA